jgi:tRNA(fMet)-specific endonuclease VapC
MSGERYLLDTNAVVALLRGDRSLHYRLQNAQWVGISILSQIEFLAFPNLSQEDRQGFQRFSERVDVVGLDPAEPALIETIIDLRQQYRIKLPDAIIAATAVARGSTLITDDDRHRKLPPVKSIGVS